MILDLENDLTNNFDPTLCLHTKVQNTRLMCLIGSTLDAGDFRVI